MKMNKCYVILSIIYRSALKLSTFLTLIICTASLKEELNTQTVILITISKWKKKFNPSHMSVLVN